MLLPLAYLTVTNAFATPRLLPMSDRDKDAEILAHEAHRQIRNPDLAVDLRRSGLSRPPGEPGTRAERCSLP